MRQSNLRIEQMCFEGAADPIGGRLFIDPAACGNGL